MRIGPHPEDFLELDGQTRADIRVRGGEWPSGKPRPQLTTDDLQRFISGCMDRTWGPATLVVRQKVLAVLKAEEAIWRTGLKHKHALQDGEAARADLASTLEGILEFAETGDVERVPPLETTAVAEKAVAAATTANYTRTDADAVIAFAKEQGFTRIVDHSYVDDGTARLILVKPQVSDFPQPVIQKCVEKTQYAALASSPEQRHAQVAEALDCFESYGGAELLEAGPVRATLLKRIASFRRVKAVHLPPDMESSLPPPSRAEGVASLPNGP